VPVPYPDAWSREAILQRITGKATVPPAVCALVANRTRAWPWSTYRKLCERIQTMDPITVNGVTVQIDHLATEFESADYYYFRPQRWAGGSRPLMNEFIHGALAISKSRKECESKVTALAKLLEAQTERLDFRAAFAAEWRRTRGK
jgi:hypothetical protein